MFKKLELKLEKFFKLSFSSYKHFALLLFLLTFALSLPLTYSLLSNKSNETKTIPAIVTEPQNNVIFSAASYDYLIPNTVHEDPGLSCVDLWGIDNCNTWSCDASTNSITRAGDSPYQCPDQSVCKKEGDKAGCYSSTSMNSQTGNLVVPGTQHEDPGLLCINNCYRWICDTSTNSITRTGTSPYQCPVYNGQQSVCQKDGGTIGCYIPPTTGFACITCLDGSQYCGDNPKQSDCSSYCATDQDCRNKDGNICTIDSCVLNVCRHVVDQSYVGQSCNSSTNSFCDSSGACTPQGTTGCTDSSTGKPIGEGQSSCESDGYIWTCNGNNDWTFTGTRCGGSGGGSGGPAPTSAPKGPACGGGYCPVGATCGSDSLCYSCPAGYTVSGTQCVPDGSSGGSGGSTGGSLSCTGGWDCYGNRTVNRPNGGTVCGADVLNGADSEPHLWRCTDGQWVDGGRSASCTNSCPAGGTGGNTGGTAPIQPTATTKPKAPTATTKPVAPTATSKPAAPTATSAPAQPTATTAPGQPTATTGPTATTVPNQNTNAPSGNTTVNFAVSTNGIGNNTAVGANNNPVRPNQPLTVEIINSLGQVVQTGTAQLTYDSGSGLFKGSASFNLETGSYKFRLRLFYSLWKAVFANVTSGQSMTLPNTLIPNGDILGYDNILDIRDYNAMLMCLKKDPWCQQDLQLGSDLNIDGKIDETDLNILLDSFGNRQGD